MSVNKQERLVKRFKQQQPNEPPTDEEKIQAVEDALDCGHPAAIAQAREHAKRNGWSEARTAELIEHMKSEFRKGKGFQP